MAAAACIVRARNSGAENRASPPLSWRSLSRRVLACDERRLGPDRVEMIAHLAHFLLADGEQLLDGLMLERKVLGAKHFCLPAARPAHVLRVLARGGGAELLVSGVWPVSGKK